MDIKQWEYKESDGINLDINIYFPISFVSVYAIMANGDVTLQGGANCITNIIKKDSSHFTREVNNKNIGGWWIAIGN